ncbi:very long chain fatty acid elongase 7-like [Atheta coriaria]|uniref:very long chain fatty acid elongase 7-like n=1 Tax=Dalotia coriaria TaxID=877792 RepID=UPI0031F3D38F
MWKLFLDDYSDKRLSDYPLMGNCSTLIGIVACYLLFVLKLGPAMMKNRPAFNLRTVLLVFNAVQIIMCLYIITMIVKTIPLNAFTCMTNQTTSPSDLVLLNVSYLYWVIKLIDLFDTIFFVLRKKFTQISTLHVYHHTLMVSVGWIINKYYPAGELVWLGLLNSIVHVFMYFYYFCAVMFDGKITIWWKKYITQAQILQFITLGTIYTIKLFDSTCEYPKGMLVFHLGQVSLLCYMFVNFYYNAYIKQKKTTIKKVD